MSSIKIKLFILFTIIISVMATLPSDIQQVRFTKTSWTQSNAEAWLSSNGLISTDLVNTRLFYNFIQYPPDYSTQYYDAPYVSDPTIIFSLPSNITYP